METMKKFGYLMVVVIFLFVGCSSTSGEKSTETASAKTAALTGDDNTSASNAKPVHLTKETFKEKIMDYEKNPQQWVFAGDKPAIVDFYADWCRPCRMIAPIMDELAVEYAGKVNFYKVDTEAEKELAAVFGITSLPTVIFIPASGNPSAQKGAMPKESYKQIIDQFLLSKPAAN
jgi:thioredoxin